MYAVCSMYVCSLCRDVQDIDHGMCKGSQYELQRKHAVCRDGNAEVVR